MTQPTDRPAAAVEQELKLVLTAAALRQLLRAPWWAALRAAAPRQVRLAATYYDTPDQALWREGVVLRVRREGRRWVQCVKRRATTSAVLLRRDEWEWPLPGPELAPGLLASSGLEQWFPPARAAQLVPVFTTDIRRAVHRLTLDDGTTVELAADQGRIVAGDRETAVCEVELELLGGDAASLLALARRIIAAVPARPSVLGKADRGFALAAEPRPTWSPAPRPDLPRTATAEAALRYLLALPLAHLQANEECVLANEHPEGVHQMRVAVRRLRSLLALYRDLLAEAPLAALEAELSWLAGALGPARDWEVFHAELVEPLREGMPDDPAVAALADAAEAPRRATLAHAQAALADRRYALLILDLAEWANGTAGSARDEQAAARLAAPAEHLANALLQRQLERLRKRGRHFRRHAPEQRHRLRLAAKKLRYALEFFASLYPRRAARAYLEALVALQDELGRYNDLITARTLVHHLIDHASGARRTGLAYAAGLLVGWHAGDAQAHAKRQRRAWRAVRRLPPCWPTPDESP